MPNRFASVLSASVLSCVAAAAFAQTAPSAKPSESTTVAPVTVEAAAKPKVIQKQTFRFVEGYTASPNPELDQIVRWRDPACVQVEGLAADLNARVKARLEDVAQAVGMPKARAGCAANVEIIFTAKPQAILDEVYKRREQLLGYDHRARGKQLKTVTRPIQAWYVTATLGSSASPADPPTPYEVVDDRDNHPPRACGINHNFTLCLRTVFKNILVVVDVNRLEGKELGLVSDYLVMLTLSEPKSLDACNALTSVLDVLAPSGCGGRDAPDGLTPGDAAYLTALYTADPEARGMSAASDVAGRMAKILTKSASSR